ncbi:MAG: glycosyltransferase family 9 protein [Pseudomonas sp.]|uniref:glycosyltransferase family 9 protein n=1 Tax=Pseudomonas sp. TaxID=306 RepID=UPI001D8E4FF2|nr:glycosyltransferase family 9 protein [Pseudomonas sp.]MPS98069.1 glycosyltransferase family 9 protein [Pseudomonas sp.]
MALKLGWDQARRILAVRLDGMGDVLMTSPALAALRAGHPQMHITLLTSAAGVKLSTYLPMVDDTLEYAAPWVGTSAAVEDTAARDLDFIATLAQGRFDAAVIFTVCTQSALPAAMVCRLAGIGLRLAHSRENPYALLTDWAAETDTSVGAARHEVRRQLDLVAHAGFHTSNERLRLQYGTDDVRRMREALAAAGASAQRPYIVVHPGANAPSRRYPASGYGRAAHALRQLTGYQIVFTGDEHESALIEEATTQMQPAPLNLAGRLDLGSLAALIDHAEVLVCNNTGPAHMAAALGTPVVVLYALTNPQHTPWQVPCRVLSHDVSCRNCLKSQCPQGHHDCLERVQPSEIVRAVLQFIPAAGKLAAPGAKPMPTLMSVTS